MEIRPVNGVFEIGSILWSPAMQRTRLATEVIYLVGEYGFSLQAPSIPDATKTAATARVRFFIDITRTLHPELCEMMIEVFVEEYIPFARGQWAEREGFLPLELRRSQQLHAPKIENQPMLFLGEVALAANDECRCSARIPLVRRIADNSLLHRELEHKAHQRVRTRVLLLKNHLVGYRAVREHLRRIHHTPLRPRVGREII